MGGYNLGFTSGYSPVVQYSAKDLENAAKYAAGAAIVDSEAGPFDGAPLMLGITALGEAPKIINWAKRAKDNGGIAKAWKADLTKIKDDFKLEKDLLKGDGWKMPSTYKAIYAHSKYGEAVTANEYAAEKFTRSDNNFIEKLTNADKSSQEYSLWTRVKAFFTGNETIEYEVDRIDKLEKKAIAAKEELALAASKDAAARKAIATDTRTFTETASDFFSKTPEAGKAATEVSEVVSKGSKFVSFMKGNALFAIISGVSELFGQIIPTFTQLGAGKGINQILKSTAKVGASVGGWAAGAAAGAAIGSIIPGAGTVIGGLVGALCGFVGGCVGSWAATKVTEKIVGKDELEIAKEEEAKKLAQEAAKNPQVAQQVMSAAAQRLQSEGTDSPDAKVAFGSLTNLAKAQPQAQTIASAGYNNPGMNFNGLSSNPFSGSKNFMDKDLIAMYGGVAS